MTSTDQQVEQVVRSTEFSGRWRALLLASVAACAACGIVYELALLTLSAIDGILSRMQTMAHRFDPAILREYDIRGIVGTDQWLMQFMVLHFIETYMAKYDSNHDQLIEESESITAFPVFQLVLQNIVVGQGLTDADAEPIYTYLFKYGSPPTGFGGDLQYLEWKNESSSWSYSADRTVLADILSALNSF